MIGWEGVTSIAALMGVVLNFVRIGKWQGTIEAKVHILEREAETALTKFDVIGKRLEETSRLLAELNTKLEIILRDKYDKA